MADVSPAARATHNKNVLNNDIQFYMNAGCWQNNQTDFALVSGTTIALCSWLNLEGKTPKKPYEPDKEVQTDLIQDFLAGGEKGCTVCMDWYRCRSSNRLIRFAGDDELFVFVGDTHIHLFKEALCDDFVGGGRCHTAPITDHPAPLPSKKLDFLTNKLEVTSLGETFAKFIDYATTDKKVDKEHLWHLGDLYEVWEIQGIFEVAFDRILKHHVHGFRPKPDDDLPYYLSDSQRDRWKSARNERTHERAIYKFLNISGNRKPSYNELALHWAQNALIEDALLFFFHKEPPKWFSKWLAHPTKKHARRMLLQTTLAFTDREAVTGAIRDMYPELTKTMWDKIDKPTTIKGNHDNDEVNHYLRWKFHGVGDRADVIKGWTENDDPAADRPKKVFDDPCTICIEHGHAADPFNNDRNFFRIEHGGFVPDAGYLTTVKYVEEEMTAAEILFVKDRVGTDGVALLDKPAIDDFADRRAEQILNKYRAPGSNQAGRVIRLVVFGHTHKPKIVDVGKLRIIHDVRQKREKLRQEAFREKLRKASEGELEYIEFAGQPHALPEERPLIPDD